MKNSQLITVKRRSGTEQVTSIRFYCSPLGLFKIHTNFPFFPAFSLMGTRRNLEDLTLVPYNRRLNFRAEFKKRFRHFILQRLNSLERYIYL